MRRLLAIALATSACASSPLIRPDDREFLRAQERLQATEARVGAEGAPPAEAALFLQAESFYRYRFGLRLHGARSLAAQVAAAAIDFGPISVLAAGNGIGDLRLTAYDGAVQLYEAQLERYPRGKLAPLALYRLGWAYRRGSIDGFPRESDAAFAQLQRAALDFNERSEAEFERAHPAAP